VRRGIPNPRGNDAFAQQAVHIVPTTKTLPAGCDLRQGDPLFQNGASENVVGWVVTQQFYGPKAQLGHDPAYQE